MWYTSVAGTEGHSLAVHLVIAGITAWDWGDGPFAEIIWRSLEEIIHLVYWFGLIRSDSWWGWKKPVCPDRFQTFRDRPRKAIVQRRHWLLDQDWL